jgi:hypothetical protein
VNNKKREEIHLACLSMCVVSAAAACLSLISIFFFFPSFSQFHMIIH